jgi:hypothetical protein
MRYQISNSISEHLILASLINLIFKCNIVCTYQGNNEEEEADTPRAVPAEEVVNIGRETPRIQFAELSLDDFEASQQLGVSAFNSIGSEFSIASAGSAESRSGGSGNNYSAATKAHTTALTSDHSNRRNNSVSVRKSLSAPAEAITLIPSLNLDELHSINQDEQDADASLEETDHFEVGTNCTFNTITKDFNKKNTSLSAELADEDKSVHQPVLPLTPPLQRNHLTNIVSRNNISPITISIALKKTKNHKTNSSSTLNFKISEAIQNTVYTLKIKSVH